MSEPDRARRTSENPCIDGAVHTWAPPSLQSKIESAVAALLILILFLCSAKSGRFSVPAVFRLAAARSPGQAWPQATGEVGAKRA